MPHTLRTSTSDASAAMTAEVLRPTRDPQVRQGLLETMLTRACATNLLGDRLRDVRAVVAAGIHSAELAERLRSVICRGESSTLPAAAGIAVYPSCDARGWRFGSRDGSSTARRKQRTSVAAETPSSGYERASANQSR